MPGAALSIGHRVGLDPAFVRLREKYYALGGRGWDVEGPGGRALARFCLLRESESGIAFRCATHPSSYFSPSLTGTEGWGRGDWSALLRGAGKGGLFSWDLARFNMLGPDQARELSRAAWGAGFPAFAREVAWPVVRGGRSFAEYASERSSSFNRNQNRCRRLMEGQGFRYVDSVEPEAALEVFRARAGGGGDGRGADGREDYSATPEFQGFLRELRAELSGRGLWREVGIVGPDGRLSAFVMGFRGTAGSGGGAAPGGDSGARVGAGPAGDGDAGFYCFQTAHDPAHRNLRLGALCFERIIERALAEGCGYVSFMGDSRYFEQFTADRFEFRCVDVFNRSPRGLFLCARRLAGAGVRRARAAFRSRAGAEGGTEPSGGAGRG